MKRFLIHLIFFNAGKSCEYRHKGGFSVHGAPVENFPQRVISSRNYYYIYIIFHIPY